MCGRCSPQHNGEHCWYVFHAHTLVRRRAHHGRFATNAAWSRRVRRGQRAADHNRVTAPSGLTNSTAAAAMSDSAGSSVVREFTVPCCRSPSCGGHNAARRHAVHCARSTSLTAYIRPEPATPIHISEQRRPGGVSFTTELADGTGETAALHARKRCSSALGGVHRARAALPSRIRDHAVHFINERKLA